MVSYAERLMCLIMEINEQRPKRECMEKMKVGKATRRTTDPYFFSSDPIGSEIRSGQPGLAHRHEKHGTLVGLMSALRAP